MHTHKHKYLYIIHTYDSLVYFITAALSWAMTMLINHGGAAFFLYSTQLT